MRKGSNIGTLKYGKTDEHYNYLSIWQDITNESMRDMSGWCVFVVISSAFGGFIHYNDVIMSAMASEITSPTIVYSTVHSGTDERKYQSSASLAFCVGNSPVTGEFPAQRTSNAEKVSIW